jgi:demethylmenaquinone methyltransferase/2-methoxy-6-polyprenyl-1,4-benzoquinol methylase
MTFRLPNTAEKADYVQRQFDRIAFRYDLSNDVISFGMHRLWKNRAINALNLKADGIYLDVCCGTGDLALSMARHIEKRSSVGEKTSETKNKSIVGLDFSENMLAVAQARSLRANAQDSIDWLLGDAQNLPFTDQSFDGAIISFGLRNLTDLQKSINEMARVVKPGGYIVNLDLGHPTMPVFTPFYHFFFNQLVPILGQVLQGDKVAYTYLPESLKTYPKPEGISALFRNAGLLEVDYQLLALGSVALHKGMVP